MQQAIVRLIEQKDNEQLAAIIRASLKEFGANKPGTVYFDDTTDHLFELFQSEKAVYHVAELNEKLVGGGGIFPTAGLDAETCELVKLYLSTDARGLGIGKLLMQECLKTAALLGFKRVYIETMPELITAIPMYEKFGFTYLKGPLGNSGHNGCDVWMLKEL